MGKDISVMHSDNTITVGKEVKAWSLTEENFGPLLPYIKTKNITDIDWDSNALWVTDINGVSKQIMDEELTEGFASRFIQFVANHENKPFNRADNILTSDTETLRITCAHESLVTSGTCFSIRKSLPGLRFTAHEAVQNKYCDEEVLHLITNCIKAGLSINMIGTPGSGKTECAKFFSSFIPKEDKVITIEDTKEWHYAQVNPGKRCLEIKVDDYEDYEKAIKVALRLNPKWLMLSEARSREVVYYIEGLSTGVHGISTSHTDDVRKLPDRMKTMAGDIADKSIIDTIHMYLNMGIMLKQMRNEYGYLERKIVQVGFYYRENEENKCAVVYEHGKLHKDRIPKDIMQKFKDVYIEDPFYSAEFKERVESKR